MSDEWMSEWINERIGGLVDDTGAAPGLDEVRTRVVEFSEFADEPGDPQDLPYQPTLDLNVRLSTEDFRWKLDFANDSSTQYTVVCQLRKSTSRLASVDSSLVIIIIIIIIFFVH